MTSSVPRCGATMSMLISMSSRRTTMSCRFVLSEQPAAVAQGTTAARWTLDLSKQNDSGIKIDAPTVGG